MNSFYKSIGVVMAILVNAFFSSSYAETTVSTIIPEAGTTLVVLEDGTVSCVIYFTDEAKITEAVSQFSNNTYNCSFNPLAGEGDLSYVWQVVFPKEYITALSNRRNLNMSCSVKAADADGNPISLNGDDIIPLNYKLPEDPEETGWDFEVVIPESIYGSLDHINVNFPNGYMTDSDFNQVLEDGTIFNYFRGIEISGPGGFKSNASYYEKQNNQAVFITNPITESGTYTVYLPFRAFTCAYINKPEDGSLGDREGDLNDWSRVKIYTFDVDIVPTSLMEPGEVSNIKRTYVPHIDKFIVEYPDPQITFTSISVEGGNVPEAIYSSMPVTLNIDLYGSYKIYPYILEGKMVCEMESVEDVFGGEPPTGSYTLIVPAGILTDANGALNQLQSFDYVVMKQSEPGLISPETTGSDGKLISYLPELLETVTIDWDNTLSKIEDSDDIYYTTASSPNSYVTLKWGEEVKFSDDNTMLLITLSQLPGGEVTLYIPEAFVFVGGELINAPQSISYLIYDPESSVVDSLISEKGARVIYDLNGNKICIDQETDTLKNLPAGIYIVNGKKLIITRP